MTVRRSLAALAAIGLLSASCGEGPTAPSQEVTTSATPGSSSTSSLVEPTPSNDRNWWRVDRTRPASLDEESGRTITFASSALDPLLRAAHLVIEGVVEEIDGPYWNSSSGQADAEDADGVTRRRLLYRELQVSISNVLYDELGVSELSTIRLVVSGGGSVSLVPDDVGPVLNVGDRVVLIVRWQSYLFAEGEADVLSVLLRQHGVLSEVAPGVYAQMASGLEAPILPDGESVTDRYPDGMTIAELTSMIGEIKAVPASDVSRGALRFENATSLEPFPEDGDFAVSPSG